MLNLTAIYSMMTKKGYYYSEGITNDVDNDLFISFSEHYNGRGNMVKMLMVI